MEAPGPCVAFLLEGSVDCERKAKKFIQDKLKVPNANKLVMGRVNRIGPYKPNQSKPRQTIVKFDLFKHRNKVWVAKKNLPRGSSHSVKENFSKETERARAQLTPIMKVARKRGYYAKLDGQRLIVSSHDKGVNLSVTLDSLDKLPQDISADSVYTPTKNGITLYYSLHSPFSNFFKCFFHDDKGKEYNGVEQYYIHNNALIANDHELAHWVMLQDDPAVMKSRAKSLRSLDPDINVLKLSMT